MSKNIFKIIKTLFICIFTFSLFIFSSCDDIEDVTLDAGLQSISITRLPDKIRYSRTDLSLDKTGLEVSAHYRSGSSKLIPLSELTFSGFRETEGFYASNETITITYSNDGITRQTSYQISYSDLANIQISSQPEKTRYTQNTPLDLTGLIVNASYLDSSTQPVFSASILEMLYLVKWGTAEESIITEQEYLKIKSYRGRDENNNVVSLTIPLSYQMDENMNFVRDENGERILTSQIEITGFDDTFSGYVEGQQQVLVKYTEISSGYFAIEKEAAFSVKLASLAGLSVVTSPSKVYYTKSSVLNFEGLTLRASYSDGSTETVFSNGIYQNLELSDSKKKEIKNFVGGTDKTLSIPLEWKTDSNGNTIYRGGEPVAARSVVFSGFDSINANTNTVKVKYLDDWGAETVEVEAQFNIIYEIIQGINITSEPTKNRYKRGESFDLSGLVVKAVYTNNKTEILFSDAVFENLDTISPLERLQIQGYTGGDGQPLVIPIEWKRNADGSIETDGAGKKIPLRKLIIKDFDSTKIIPSEQVTITLEDCTVDIGAAGYSVDKYSSKFAVSFIDIAGVQLSTNPTKLKYFKNEPLDLRGIVLNAQYEDNSMSTIFSDDIFTSLTTLTQTEKDQVKAFTGKQSGIVADYDKDSFGRKWYKQLEYNGLAESNTLTIPLEWKKNYWGDYVDEDGSIIADQNDVSKRVCVKGFTIIGFDSSVTTSSQTVRIRYAEKTSYGAFIREVSFNVTFKILDSIQISSLPDNAYLGNVKDNPISFDGIVVTARYTDNTSETVFSQKIYEALPSLYKPTLGTNYSGDATHPPLSITLQKRGDDIIREIEFKGYNSESPSQQTVTVTYYEGTDYKDATYNIRYDGVQSIQITQLPATNYIMNADSATGVGTGGTVGGIGRTEVNRKDIYEQLDDISNWHFNADGMKIKISYNNGSNKDLTFINSFDKYCYGSNKSVGNWGANSAYIEDDSKLLYMQRWSEATAETEGNRYKIKIEGFDPIAVFTTSNQRSGSQILTISYTENETTVSTQLQINYDFTPSYKLHTTPEKVNGDAKNVKFGDYPQTRLIGDVKINKYKEDKGLYKYQVGSDGNYYCEKTVSNGTYYYLVEPLVWSRIGDENDGYYISKVVVDNGVPYYSGKTGRKNTKQETVVCGSSQEDNNDIIQFTAIQNYDIGDASFVYSTVRNWLNGDNINGDSAYNGKGFLQTAFGDATKLQDIGVTEYFNTEIKVIGSNEVATASNKTYRENFSVKIILPSDMVKGGNSVTRRFLNNFDCGVPGDAITYATTEDQTSYNNINSKNDFLKPVDYSVRGTSFSNQASTYWLASDICNLDTAKPNENYPGRYHINSAIKRYTNEKLTDSLSTVGIVPIIKLGRL